MTKYVGVSLPVKILDEIDAVVLEHPYSSRADFVKEAVRRELQRLKQ